MNQKKNLSELFNGITGIIKNPGDFNLDPDTKWFDDLNNRRQLYRNNPNSFAYYSPETDTPQFPIVDKSGKPNIQMMIKSLAMALFVQSKNPSIEGLDDVIHKLENIINTYRQDLSSVPEYRLNLVKTRDVTQTLNNLVYGPYEPNHKLAVMVSSLSGNDERLNLGDIKIDTNTSPQDFQRDPPVDQRVNQPIADRIFKNNRVNMVQEPNTDSKILAPEQTANNHQEQDMQLLLKDLAMKVAQLKAQKIKSNTGS